MLLLMLSLGRAEGFKANSNRICTPSFAAADAFRDLATTKNEIIKLTSSEISTDANAVLRKGTSETVLIKTTEKQASLSNPCKSSTFYNKVFSPTSSLDLRKIVLESPRKGFAYFKIKRQGTTFVSDSGLHIRAALCDENTTRPVGCLDLEKIDEYNCCTTSPLFKVTPPQDLYYLCTGSPQKSIDSSRLSTKRNTLFAGLKLVESILPKALRMLIKLRTKLDTNKVKLLSEQKASYWTAPTPVPKIQGKPCLPVIVDPFDHPPTFVSNALVTPSEYKSYENNVDTLSNYISYLEKIQPLLKQNGNFTHILLRNNNLSPSTYFSEWFSNHVILYTLPASGLAILSFIVIWIILQKSKTAIKEYCTTRALQQSDQNTMSHHFFRMIAFTNQNRDIEMRPYRASMEASAPCLPMTDPDHSRRTRIMNPQNDYMSENRIRPY